MSAVINDNTPPQEVRFLRLLDKEATAFTFQTFADAEALKHRADLRIIFHGDARDVRLHQMHDAGAGIYITVNETNGRGRKSEDVVRVRAVWRENDGGDLPPLPVEPSLVVETSPGHFHEYILVTGDWPADEQGRAEFAGVMERMVESHGCDKNAKDISRVLRVPGFLNRKYGGDGHAVRIFKVHPQMRRYTREEILKAFPPICKTKATPIIAEFAPSGADEARIRDALFVVNADDRQMWLECGMALRAELGEGGRGLWDSWSQTSSKYEARDQEKTWRSFRRNGIGIGTVFHHAQAAGWRPAAPIAAAFNTEPGADGLPQYVIPGCECADGVDDLSAGRRPAERNGHESGTAKPADGDVRSQLPFIDMSDWDSEPLPDREWAVLNRIPLKQTALLSGEGGAGKSYTALHLCCAHALGKDWLYSLPEPGPAIFIDAEDDERELHIRAKAIAQHYRVTFNDLIKGGLQLLSYVGRDVVLATLSRSGKIEPTELYHQLLEAAGDIKPKMITIASSANVFAGNENDRNQVQQFVGLLTRMAIQANGAVSLINHPSLTGINTGTGLSGTTQWHNAVRARCYMTGVKAEPGEQPDSDLREIVFKKNQYGPQSENIVLRYQNGMFLPVMGMKSLDRAALEMRAREVFLAILRRLEKENRHVSDKTGTSYAPALFAKEDEARAAMLTSKHLADAMRQLFKDDKIWNEPHGRPSQPRFHIAIKS